MVPFAWGRTWPHPRQRLHDHQSELPEQQVNIWIDPTLILTIFDLQKLVARCKITQLQLHHKNNKGFNKQQRTKPMDASGDSPVLLFFFRWTSTWSKKRNQSIVGWCYRTMKTSTELLITQKSPISIRCLKYLKKKPKNLAKPKKTICYKCVNNNTYCNIV